MVSITKNIEFKKKSKLIIFLMITNFIFFSFSKKYNNFIFMSKQNLKE